MGTRKNDKHQLLTWTCTHQITSWLVHSLNTFGARTNHEQIRTHKTHHDPDLGEATTFPLIVYSVLLHEAHIQMTFCPKIPKWESQNFQSWDFRDFGAPITLCVDLWLRWGLKQSCSPCWELLNDMSYATCTQGSWVNSWLLVVGVKLPIWLPTFLLAITCVLNVEINHANPF
jgi:hypothetical protein